MNEYARDGFTRVNGLDLHHLEWGRGERHVVLLHGFLEHAHTWDFVAPDLAAAGHHVWALDWRGHGDSAWVGAGGYYHFADYLADLALWLRRFGGAPVALVGHSMGGSAASLYAGLEPERIGALALIEGIGPPGMEPERAPERYAAWIGDLERGAERPRRAMASLEDAAARQRERFPLVPLDAALHLARHGTRREDGGWVFKFDPLHQTTSPQPYSLPQARSFWRRVRCPVLFVQGAESGITAMLRDLDERLDSVRAQRVRLAGCGHHPQLEVPRALSGALLTFLGVRPT